MSDALLVLTNVPDRAIANEIARALVEGRLAACVSIGGAMASIYRWQGKVETAEEFALTIKTTQQNYARVEAAVRALHPYELPEIIAVSITRGLTGYLDWIVAETLTDS